MFFSPTVPLNIFNWGKTFPLLLCSSIWGTRDQESRHYLSFDSLLPPYRYPTNPFFTLGLLTLTLLPPLSVGIPSPFDRLRGQDLFHTDHWLILLPQVHVSLMIHVPLSCGCGHINFPAQHNSISFFLFPAALGEESHPFICRFFRELENPV